MKSVVVIGATSAIAQHIAREHADRHDRIYLVGRNEKSLESQAADLKVRGATQCAIHVIDLVSTDQHSEIWQAVYQQFVRPDVVYIAHGVLPDQDLCEKSFLTARNSIEINTLSVISLLTDLANRMQAANHGCIAVISSVAGDRGRQSNYVYGASKAMLNCFCEGLRNRLHQYNVQVTTIKPGFVDTPMTAEFEKGPLWASADSAGKAIVRAVDRGKTEVYIPGFWRLIMLVIRCIPEAIFKRLKL